MKKLYLIDGMSVAFRAYYAMEQSGLANQDGLPTGAIFSFVNIITSFLEKLHPVNIAVAFDCRQPTFRHKLYPEYKANRREFPEDLGTQLPYIKDFLRLIGITCIEQPGYEADDIIGTLSVQAAQNGMEVYCLTSDKDFYQLLNESVSVLRISKNTTDLELVKVGDVKGKFGVEASQVIDYLALIGDTSDNVPGVKGVGEKTAIPLLEQFGTLENIYKNIDKIEKERVKSLLVAGKDTAILSKELVTIDTAVPLGSISNEDLSHQAIAESNRTESSLNLLALKDTNYEELDKFFNQLNFKQLREK